MQANLNLMLMRIFVSVHDLRSVGLAARALRMSQSGVSSALAKLRRMLEDPLFVATASGMQPTLRARELIEPMREALGCIDQRILRRARFDPLTDDREFTIVLSDMAEAIFMPRALNAVARAAPHVRLRSVALPQAELQQALSEGRLDLALGYMPDLVSSEFVRRKIDQHAFVCICSAANRKMIQGFNLEKYLEARHVVVQAPGRTQGLFERYLQERRIERRVALTTPHFMSLPEIVAGTDMLASIPGALAGFFVEMKRLVRLELPFRSPVFENHLHWSKSVHSDPAHRWLRDTLFRAFAGKA